jgi:actin-related protein
MKVEEHPIIIDSGSGICKAGISGDDRPRVCFPSIVGEWRYKEIMIGSEYNRNCVGEWALSKRGVLNISYPMKHGVVHDS